MGHQVSYKTCSNFCFTLMITIVPFIGGRTAVLDIFFCLHYIDLGLGSNFCTNNYSYFPFYLITNYSASKRSYYTSKRCYYYNVLLLWFSILNLTEHYLIRQTFGVQKFVMSINVLWLNNDPIHDELFR